MKESQVKIVKNKILITGFVSRNWCLERYISRLSAIIQILESEGWEFKTERRWINKKDNSFDYFYNLVKIGKV